MSRRRPEDQLQKTIVAHITMRGARDMLWWHTPNGGWRSKVEARILKGVGARAGVGDLLFLRGGVFFSLELKVPGRTSTDRQIEWREHVNEFGGFADEAVGLDRALAILEKWKLLRGSTQ